MSDTCVAEFREEISLPQWYSSSLTSVALWKKNRFSKKSLVSRWIARRMVWCERFPAAVQKKSLRSSHEVWTWESGKVEPRGKLAPQFATNDNRALRSLSSTCKQVKKNLLANLLSKVIFSFYCILPVNVLNQIREKTSVWTRCSTQSSNFWRFLSHG